MGNLMGKKMEPYNMDQNIRNLISGTQGLGFRDSGEVGATNRSPDFLKTLSPKP